MYPFVTIMTVGVVLYFPQARGHLCQGSSYPFSTPLDTHTPSAPSRHPHPFSTPLDTHTPSAP